MFIEPHNSQPLSDLAQKYPDNYPTSHLPLPPNNHLYTHMCCLYFPYETTVVAILRPVPIEPITETHPHTILAFRNTALASRIWPDFSVPLIIVRTISLDNFSNQQHKRQTRSPCVLWLTRRCFLSNRNFSAFASSYSPFSKCRWSGRSLESVGGNFSCTIKILLYPIRSYCSTNRNSAEQK